jgi:hypothetical protein
VLPFADIPLGEPVAEAPVAPEPVTDDMASPKAAVTGAVEAGSGSLSAGQEVEVRPLSVVTGPGPARHQSMRVRQ